MQFQVYEEKPYTIRVHGGAEYFELFLKIKNKLTQHGVVQLAFMGSPPAWQACQALCVLCSSFSVNMCYKKFEFKTPEGNRIGVVVTITPSEEKEPAADEGTEN